MRYCIVFTICDQPNYCIIHEWLDKTDIPIILVLNRNDEILQIDLKKYGKRLETLYYDEDSESYLLKQIHTKGYHEMYAMNYVYHHSQSIIKESDYIIKINNDIFIEDFNDLCTRINKDTYFILGDDVVGCKKIFFTYLFHLIYYDPEDHVKEIYQKRMHRFSDHHTICWNTIRGV